MPKKDIKLDIPLVGEVILGRWFYSCEHAYSMVMPKLTFASGIDIEVSAKKIKTMAGAVGKIIQDDQLSEFMESMQELVPSGKIGLKVALKPDLFVLMCGPRSGNAHVLGYSLKIEFIGSIAGNYGLVKGGAYVIVEIEIAAEDVTCECPEEGASDEEGAMAPSRVGSGNHVLAADVPLIGPVIAGRVETSQGHTHLTSAVANVTADVSAKDLALASIAKPPPSTGEARIISVDVDTGEEQVLRVIPLS